MRGRSAVLVEARDRLGGRTYTADHDVRAMELGGTGVHPFCSRAWGRDQPLRDGTETFPVLWAVARTCGGDADDAFLGQRSFA